MRHDVRRWFERRTSAAGSWPEQLLLERKFAGPRPTRVSVVLPARDEEATVGDIVSMLRHELMERVPLIDELLVIDSGSTDRTSAVAAAAGATVVPVAEVLTELGTVPGKGEVLWKSLYVTSGDLLVFLDADLVDVGPHFVTGLLGPLLTDPQVDYVKATAERPLTTTSGVAPAGGGRVTELVARPMINLYWPQLAGFVQPLSGEYAGRRTVLEAVPFVSGYGVELALLIDLLDLVGLDALAQVDLGRRVHRNQPDAALGRMASAILQTAMSRLDSEGRAKFADTPSTNLVQFARLDDRYDVTVTDVQVSQRPAMATVPAYVHRRRLLQEWAG